MKARVLRWRENGRLRTSIGRTAEVRGSLYLAPKKLQDRTVIRLSLLGDQRLIPDLYEPRLTLLGGAEMHFVGFEVVDHAWVVQEWHCILE